MAKIWGMTQKFQYMVGEMLPADKDTVLEIESVAQQTVEVQDKKETMPVVKFKKAKRPLALNSRTLIRQFIKAIGSDDTDDWIGVKVSLYRDVVSAFGTKHNVVRIRERLPAQGGKVIADDAEQGQLIPAGDNGAH